MSITLKNADTVLKSVYRDMVMDELKKLKTSGKVSRVACRECGRSGVTLRKCSDGQYICEHCMKEEK